MKADTARKDRTSLSNNSVFYSMPNRPISNTLSFLSYSESLDLKRPSKVLSIKNTGIDGDLYYHWLLRRPKVACGVYVGYFSCVPQKFKYRNLLKIPPHTQLV